MTKATARGTFEVKLSPVPSDEEAVGAMTIVKTLTGDLAATGRGIMIAARTEETGAAAYAAIERITGTLAGRSGSFALHHLGTMEGEGHTLDVTVLAGSGTDELAGLSGTMTITVEDGRHSYEFYYMIPSLSA